MKRFLTALFIPLILLIILNCESRLTDEEKQILEKVQLERAEKDSLFQHADWSPIPEDVQGSFEGLHYYPVNMSWRFEGPITQYDSIIKDTIMGTRGDLRPALRYGYFNFTINNETLRLEIYKIIRSQCALIHEVWRLQ